MPSIITRHKPESLAGNKMKPVKRVSFQGSEAVLFSNGDVMWSGMIFEQGKAANAGLLKALGV